MKLNDHNLILTSIQSELSHVQKDISVQIDLFRKKRSNKKYTGIRKDKGYTKWRTEVLNRFNQTCCVCLSNEKIVCHHLYSYKYYPDLRTDVNNGACICNDCHELFNTHYSNINTLDQFLEFRELMKKDETKNYLTTSFKLLNGNEFIADLKSNGDSFKVIKYKFLKIIIVEDDAIYCSKG